MEGVCDKVGFTGQRDRAVIACRECACQCFAVRNGNGVIAVDAVLVDVHAINAGSFRAIAAQDGNMDGFQKLTHSRGAQRGHAHTHGVEHDRDAHTVGLCTSQQHSVQFARR